jgi:hypothetical protein
MEAGFGAATAAAGATGADGAMGGFNPAGASGAEGGFGGVRPIGGEGGLSPAGGSGAPLVGAGAGFGGRLIMAFSRGFPAADCPSRRGGRTMRTVSFFGSLINSGVICSKKCCSPIFLALEEFLQSQIRNLVHIIGRQVRLSGWRPFCWRP